MDAATSDSFYLHGARSGNDRTENFCHGRALNFLSERPISTTTDFHDLICGGLYSALIFIVGYSVLCVWFKPGVKHWLQILGMSYAAGGGVVSLLLFFASLAGAKPSRSILFCILCAAAGLLIFQFRRTGALLKASVPCPRRKFDPITLLAMVSLGVLLLSICNVSARAGWSVLYNIDAFAIWLFKAKCVVLDPLRPLPRIFRDPILSYSHQDYPLSFPFLIAGFYTALGRIDDQLIKFVVLPIYLSLIAVVYSGVRRMHRRATALTLTAVFAAGPTLSVNAGCAVAETPLILAYSCTLMLLLAWIETGEAGSLPLAGLFAAISAFTKNEGLALLPVMCAAAAVGSLAGRHRGGFKQAGLALLVCGIAVGPWLRFRMQLPKTHENYGDKLTSTSVIAHNLSRLGYVLVEFPGRCLDVSNAGFIWIVLIIAALVGWRAFRTRAVWIFWCILIIQLTLYIGTFIVTPWNVEELLPMIASKLLVQASPVALVLIALHLRRTRWPGASFNADPGKPLRSQIPQR